MVHSNITKQDIEQSRFFWVTLIKCAKIVKQHAVKCAYGRRTQLIQLVVILAEEIVHVVLANVHDKDI